MKKEDLKKEYEAGGVVVTKDNIHLYYEFMSDEDIKNLDNSNLRDIATGAPIITTILSGRFCNVRDSLQIHSSKMDEFKKCVYGLNDFILSQSVFGVKDTLKPIDEYIEEIKESEGYKAYIASSNKPSKEELRAFDTGEMPNSPNYAKRCNIERLRTI